METDTVIKWNGEKRFPLTVDTPVRVWFRDGSHSDLGTVGDWYGAGGDDSNWEQIGDVSDIMAYEVRHD